MSIDPQETKERTPSAALAAFASNLDHGDVPDRSLQLAERCLLDTAGVTLAGSAEGAGAVAAAMVRRVGDRGPASLIGRDGTASLTDAGFVNEVFH